MAFAITAGGNAGGAESVRVPSEEPYAGSHRQFFAHIYESARNPNIPTGGTIRDSCYKLCYKRDRGRQSRILIYQWFSERRFESRRPHHTNQGLRESLESERAAIQWQPHGNQPNFAAFEPVYIAKANLPASHRMRPSHETVRLPICPFSSAA